LLRQVSEKLRHVIVRDQAS
jgi:hypothetical protein